MEEVMAVEASWSDQKIKLRKKFTTLTERDLMFWEGKKEQMFTKLQGKLRVSRNELLAIITQL